MGLSAALGVSAALAGAGSAFFGSAAAVHWEKFSEAFVGSLNQRSSFYQRDIQRMETSSVPMRCLRELLVDGQDLVQRRTFGKILGWFGPLQFPLQAAGDFGHMLNRIVDTLQLPYFHGNISGTEANAMLSSEKEGTFLIRFSVHHGHSLCISYTVGGGRPTKHIVIQCTGGLFYYEDQPCRSVAEVATRAAPILGLRRYVETEHYAHLFTGAPDEDDEGEYAISGYTLSGGDDFMQDDKI